MLFQIISMLLKNGMPEGDRDFSMWLKNIESLVRGFQRFLLLFKEVGFGMSRENHRRN